MNRAEKYQQMAALGYESARAALEMARNDSLRRNHYRKLARAFRREASADAAEARFWSKKNA